MIVSIHQPNYLPWLGFFDKIAKSDLFVVFDDVQFPRGKNHFGHRNLIKTNADSKWLTVPLINKNEFKNFNQLEINYNGWNHEHLRLMEVFYKNTPFFNVYYEDIRSILSESYNSLSDMNIVLIKYFMKCLDIDTTIVLSSEICPTNIFGSNKIFHILNEVTATKYITGSGLGSLRYINEDEFKNRNIELIWQHYNHPVYTQQFGEFKPYMSIIDLLFNEGVNSKNII
jgi:hypothetical protein